MERSVRVRLDLAIGGYTLAAAQAVASTKAIKKEVTETARTSQREMQTIGTAAAVMGGAVVAGFGLAGRSAIRFESSFAGVRKTVNASEPEFARLAAGMRDLSRSIPTDVNELNAIGESAGQLGIATEHLLGFTRTMADLGETTNLSSEEAATSLARLANITQMPQTEFDRLGSTIVALGNNFATTESEITEMGLRLAGAGSQIGLTEAQILGLSTALTSVGINAEAGGSALSKVMIEIASQVETGGDKLSTFASVSGQTVEQFSAQWEEDAAGALVAFITGLADTEAQGGSTLQTLEDLEITEVRMRDALLRASGAGDLLTRSMETGTEAFEANNALAEEAAQRYGTVESRLQIARNAFNDAGITIGQTFTPAIGEAADAAAGLFGAIADLPGPAAAGVTAVGALGGAASLTAGGFLLAAPRIVETRDALTKLSTQMPTTVKALQLIPSLLMGPWGAALAIGATALTVFAIEQGEARKRVAALTDTLDEQTAAVTEGTRAHVARRLEEEGAIDRANRLGISTKDVVDAALGVPEAMSRVSGVIDEARGAYADAQGTTDKYNKALTETAGEASVLEVQLGTLTGELETSTDAKRHDLEVAAQAEGKYLDVAHALDSGVSAYEAYRRGLIDTEEATDGAGSSLDGLADGFEGAGDAAADAVDPIDAFSGAVRTAIGLLLGVADAEIGWEQAIDDLSETLKENGTTLDRTTQAGRDNERAIIGAVEAATRHGEALMEEGGSAEDAAAAIAGHIDQLRQEMIDSGVAKDKVDDLLASYGATPDEIYTSIIANTADAEAALDRLAAKLSQVTGTGYVRVVGGNNVVPRGVTQHTGGVAGSGPVHTGPLKGDEIPAVLQTGEFVLSRKMVAALGGLAALSALPKMHDGGPVGSVPSGLSASSGVVSLQAAITSLDQTLKAMDRADEARDTGQRRADLWSGIDSARADVAAAQSAEERAAAEERLADAIRATQEFDRERARAAEKAELADMQAKLAADLRIATNREEFEFAQMSTAQQIRLLTRQLQAETRFTDEWMQLHSQRARLLDEQARQREQDIADAKSALSSGLSDLNQMLDDRAALLEERERAEQAHQSNISSIWSRANDEIAGLVEDRADQLRVAMGHDGFHHRAGALADQLSTQTDQLRSWARELESLRGRGVSDAVVDLLGLAEGPEALDQIRQLAASSDGEIRRLNEAARERERAVAAQVSAERKDRDTELGAEILDIRRQANADVRTAEREHNKEMREIGQELAAIGRDTGRSYSKAVAEGLKSGLPAIRKHVREIQKLMRDVKEAQAATTGVVAPDRGGQLRTMQPIAAGKMAGSSPEKQWMQSAQIRDAVVSTGHDPRSVVDLADVAAALRRIGHDYGSRVDLADIQKLVGSSNINVTTTGDASTQRIADDLMWVLRTGRG